MPDIIITPSTGKLEFIDNSAQVTRRHSFTLDQNDGLLLDAPLSAAAISAPLNIINVTVNNSNVNYPFVLAQSGETGAKNLLMDGAGGTYNPFTNTATIDISGNSATTTLASDSTNLGGVVAASYVTLTGTQTLTNKTITGTFTGNLTGTGSWATNAVSAVSATTSTNSTQLNGQAASYYTNIPARLGYTPVNQAGDTIAGNLTVNGNFTVNGSVTAFSASNIYLSSSVITVEDNILTLNAFSPYLRYAGIEMYDSGSGTLSQLLWDGEGDYFFLTGSSVNGKIITGPDGQTNLTSNYIPKATAGYKLGNSLIYDNGTNIGIGITTPVYKTEIYSGVKTSAFTGLSISNFNNYDGTANSLVKSQLRFAILENPISTYDASQRTFAILESGNEANNSSSDGFFAISTRLNGAVAEKFRITSTGYVGIGATSPTYKLQVNGGATEVVGQVVASFEKQSSTDGKIATFVNTTGSGYTSYIYIGSNPGRDWKIGKNVLNVGTTGHFQITNDLNQLRMQISAADDTITFPSSSIGIGTSSPAYKLDVGVAGSDVISVRLTPGYERVRFNTFDLLGYNDGNLWMIGNNPTNTLVLGKTWDWDNQIGIAYTPGTVGNSGGILQIGQISKNNANYTHGITRLYTNGLERITIIANGNVGIGTTLPTTPLHVVGVISGSSFSGAGTGLTGTAASLTAGTATIANGVATGAVKSGGLEENSVITSKIADGNVTNVKLASSSVTIGSSAVSLGSTLTTIAGLTSVTSTTFVGALTGNASTATSANALNASNNYQVNSIGVNIAGSGTAGRIGTNENGVRSWTITPTGGRLVFDSGDGNGSAIFGFPVTASTFVGAGTGLTGTAANLTAGTATNATQLGGVSAASYVTLNDTQSLTNKTITGTFTGNLTGTASTATTSTQLGGYDSTRFLGSRSSNITAFDFNTLTGNDILSTGAASWTGTSNFPTNAVTGNSYQYGTIVNFASLAYSAGIVQTYWPDNDNTGFYFRQKWATNAWTGRVWQQVLTNANYNSFAPTLTGTGASGNWAITSSWATNAVTALNVGNGTITIAAGTGVGVGTTNTFTTNQSGATTVTISNSGVTSNVAGTGISLSGGTGAVTITNSGVTSVAGTSNQVSVSAGTGTVTFSLPQNIHTAATPTFASVTTSADGANITMAGTTNAEGIRMTPASSTTYPVFLRSVNPGVGEASPWIYKEQATDWGIWHNNPVNSIDFTKQGSGGIASNVGGSSSNTVTVRVEMATGYVQTIAGYRNSAGTTILSDAGNITGNAATVTTNANLTGDVTSTGNATTIASNAVTSVKIADSNVTLAKIVNISTGTILGNNGAGAAAPLALTSAQVASMLSGQTMNIGGNAATATVLQTARNIGGVSFNGSADINLPGVNTAGNQNTSGTATTATTANALNTGNSYTVNALTATSEIGTRGTNIGVNLERGDATIATLRFDADNFRIWGGGTGGIGEILRVTETGNVGIGTTVVNARVESYYSSNAITFNYLATNLNNNSPIPVYGFDVTNGSTETRSIKAGIGYERHLTNGRGTLHIYNHSTDDTASLSGNRSSAGDIKMSLDNSGNLGIGTTTPATKLDIYGPVSVRGTTVLTTNFDLNAGNAADIYGNIRVLRGASLNDGMYIGYGGAGGNLKFFSNSGTTEFMTIATTGNVGIGTTSPGRKFEISDASTQYIFRIGAGVTSANYTYDIGRSTADGLLYFYGNQTNYTGYVFSGIDGERMRITGTGNVGVGTSTPGQKLDVEGRIRTRGATGTGGFEIGAATTGTAKWRIEWDSASDSLDFNWVG